MLLYYGYFHSPTNTLSSVLGRRCVERIWYIWVLYLFVGGNRTALSIGLITPPRQTLQSALLHVPHIVGFPGWAGGCRHRSRTWHEHQLLFPSTFSGGSFPAPGGFLTHMGTQFSNEWKKVILCRSQGLSVWVAISFLLFRLANSSHILTSWILGAVSQTQGVVWALSESPSIPSWGNSLTAVSWGNHRAPLTCFMPLRNHHPSLPTIWCLENWCCIHIFCLYAFCCFFR